ncbi:MAG: hypothetical protein NC218_07325 [Acetobacter sp.]|nr:hypothetical protein [Acetobacter sp.]
MMDTNKVVRAEGRRAMQALRAVGLAVCVLVAVCALVVCATVTHEAQATRQAIIDNKDEVLEQMFDTQTLETWCKGEDLGTIRMVGAWVYSNNSDGTTTLEDEQGYLWDVEGQVDANSFLLLWLVDNHTPTIAEDDEIVKVWCEWYAE